MTRARITDVAARVARVVRRMSGMSKQDAAVIMDYYRDGLETTRRLVPELGSYIDEKCQFYFNCRLDLWCSASVELAMADWEDRAGRRRQNIGQADHVGWPNTADGLGQGEFSPRETESAMGQSHSAGKFGRGTGVGADVWNAEEDSWELDRADGSSPRSRTSQDGGNRAGFFRSDSEQRAGSTISRE
jgi:hypothetical protein